MYTSKNFRSKKDLKEAVAARLAFLALKAGAKDGILPPETREVRPVTYYQPGPFGDTPTDGTFCCEGPHFPEPHKWYAECTAKNGEIVKVK